MVLAGIDGRDLLAIAGAGCALASLATPYATLAGVGETTVRVGLSLSPRSPLLVLAALVVAGAVLAVVDRTRGEQLLGALFAVVLAITVLGPLVVTDLTGRPEPGLWLLLLGWVLVDAADDLALSNPRASRRVVLGALALLAVSGSAFLWIHRAVVTTGWSDLRLGAWGLTGVIAVGAWATAAAWEWRAERA